MVSVTNDNSVANNIAVVIILLMAIGTVFVFSASANINQDIDLQRFYEYPALRQLLFFPLAALIIYSVSCIDYRRLSLEKGWHKSLTSYLLILCIAVLMLVLYQRFHPILPQLIPKINQHYRWLKIPAGPISISFQPSELAKWLIIFFLAGFCAKYSDSMKLFKKRFLPMCLVIGLVVGLIIVEDFGTAAFIAVLAFLLLMVAGAKLLYLLAPLPVGLLAFFLAIIASPTRVDRITAFLHPEQFTKNINYQPSQSLIALGSGGLWGKGLGRGICKYGHLPEDTTDFIFAIIGEELGFVGTAGVILLFVIFVWLGIQVVMRCSDRFGQLLAAGIVFAIGMQAALNIGVVTVVLPTKGIPLPFVSAGGTSMLLSAAAVGILMNIAKQTGNEPIPGENLS
jgi:cell division protein FtsW